MMKGTPYVFQGDELGMKDVPFESLDQYKDIETVFMCQKMKDNGESEETIKKYAYLSSRDNARTPFPWNGEEGSGFSDVKPWIDYSPDNKFINAEDELKDPNSVFYYYQKLIRLRKENPVIVHGSYKLLDEEDSDIFSYEREYEGKKLLVVCSFAKEKVRYTLPDDYKDAEILIGNYENVLKTDDKNIILNPYQAVVYLTKE